MTVKIAFLERSTIAPHVNLARPDFSHDWREYPGTRPEQVIERLTGCQIAIINKVELREQTLRELPELKMIAMVATGTDCIDISYCRDNGIVVSNIRSYATTSVPEHALSLIMALRRNIVAYHSDVQNGEWQKAGQFCFFNHPVEDLAGGRLGIIGAGNLGQALGRLGRAIGMDVVFAARKGAAESTADRLPFDEVLESSDVISLHCPLTDETRGLIGMKELRRMKESALLINTARGGLVDEHDLAQALRGGEIGGAGFDVLSEEPPADDHPLLQLVNQPNFILTPHIAWASSTAMQALADQLIENIEGFVAGTPLRVVA